MFVPWTKVASALQGLKSISTFRINGICKNKVHMGPHHGFIDDFNKSCCLRCNVTKDALEKNVTRGFVYPFSFVAWI